MAAPPPPTINGVALQHASARITTLSGMQITHPVTMRNGRIALQTRNVQEEAFLGQERGRIMDPPCDYCSRGLGLFVGCVVIDGMIKESCMNCHYGGNAARCTHRQNHENAVAFLTAQNVPAPDITFTTPANNFGGTMAPFPDDDPATNQAANASGPQTPARRPPRRIAPTPVGAVGSRPMTPAATPHRPRLGPSPTDNGLYQDMLDEARNFTRQERIARRAEIRMELEALREADSEDGKIDKDNDNGGEGPSDPGGLR